MGKRGKPIGWRTAGNAERDAAILRDYEGGGVSLSQVAWIHGMTKQRVHQIICEGRRKSLDDAAASD